MDGERLATQAQGSTGKLELLRQLNGWHATSIVVGTIIGSGIFLVPAEMMQAVGTARMVYAVWIVGGILSFFGALTYAELGAMKPQAGGEYVFIRDAYGPAGGFLYAWTWFIIAKPASIATVTTGIVRVLGTFPALAFLSRTALHAGVALSWGQLLAIALTIAISALNYTGVHRAGNFQLIFTGLKIAMVLAIVACCFAYQGGSWQNFAGFAVGAKGGVAGFMAALVAALWAYDGWNDLNMVAGEVKSPEKTIPLALIAGVAVVGALYMMTNAAVQYVLPASAVAASQHAASDAMRLAAGAAGAALVTAGMAISMLVTLNGTVMSGARVPYAAARDGLLWTSLARVHPRFRTPAVAIVVQCLLAIVLLAISGKFRELFSLAIFAEWLFYMIAASTIFVFRRGAPLAVRPYRTWGYPLVPAIFVLASALLLYYTFMDNLRLSFGGVVVILAGLPVYSHFARKKRGEEIASGR
jgi:APA family basic amino acid/polyamine antiporter